MNFERYVKELFNKYIIKKINFEKYYSIFEKYNDIIIKNGDDYMMFGNSYSLNLFDKNDIELLKSKYEKHSTISEKIIDDIFDKWLSIILSINNNYDKYYFKIKDEGINYKNIVDKDELIFIIKIKDNYNMNFKYYFKRINELEKKCSEIKDYIKLQYNIKVRILFDM